MVPEEGALSCETKSTHWAFKPKLIWKREYINFKILIAIFLKIKVNF